MVVASPLSIKQESKQPHLTRNGAWLSWVCSVQLDQSGESWFVRPHGHTLIRQYWSWRVAQQWYQTG